MTTLTFNQTLGDVLKHEYDTDVCREIVTLLAGTNYKLGSVLGKVLETLTVAAPTYAGTGNGVITMDPTTPVKAGAIVGSYTAVCTVAGTNSATFRVSDPKSDVLGDFAYSGAGATGSFDSTQVKFTITDGSTDFVVGDKFTIIVTAGSGKYKLAATTSTDGSQVAAGILLYNTDATSADQTAVVLVRGGAIVADVGLVYDATQSTTQLKAARQAELAALGIITRIGV